MPACCECCERMGQALVRLATCVSALTTCLLGLRPSSLQTSRCLHTCFGLLCPPPCHREESRKRTLLERRLNLIKLGAEDDFLLENHPEMHPTRIRHPLPPAMPLQRRGVWRLSGSSVVRPEAEDLLVSCEVGGGGGRAVVMEGLRGDACRQCCPVGRETGLKALPPGSCVVSLLFRGCWRTCTCFLPMQP
jgi:hypothetical protein